MGKNCEVQGCSSSQDHSPNKAFFKVLLKKADRKTLLKTVPGKPKARAAFICSDHFDSNCFSESKGKTILKSGSRPNIFPKRIMNVTTAEERPQEAKSVGVKPSLPWEDLMKKNKEENIDDDAETKDEDCRAHQESLSSDSMHGKIASYAEFLKEKNDESHEAVIRQYKVLSQKFATQNMRLAVRHHKLKSFKCTTKVGKKDILREASKSATPYQMAFIASQIINNDREPRAREWSSRMKNILVGLYHVSPEAFTFLSKILVLPSKAEVERWTEEGYASSDTEDDAEASVGGEAPQRRRKRKDGSYKHPPPAEPSLQVQESQAILEEIAFENLMSTLL